MFHASYDTSTALVEHYDVQVVSFVSIWAMLCSVYHGNSISCQLRRLIFVILTLRWTFSCFGVASDWSSARIFGCKWTLQMSCFFFFFFFPLAKHSKVEWTTYSLRLLSSSESPSHDCTVTSNEQIFGWFAFGCSCSFRWMEYQYENTCTKTQVVFTTLMFR